MRPTNHEAARRVRVGTFLLLATALLIATIFLLGRSQSLFSRKIEFTASFDNISGLVVGAPVRLGGLDIGIVKSIEFGRDLREKRVHVVLGVERTYVERIRRDSIAQITSKGLLGDTIINISVGSAEALPLSAGAELRAQESENVAEVVGEIRQVLGSVRSLSGKLDDRLSAVLTDDFARDLGRIAKATAGVAEKVERGPGLLHALIYDPRISAEATHLAADADRAVARVDRLLAQIEKGPGTMHGLVYENRGGDALSQVRDAATEIAGVVSEIRHGQGLLHDLVYEKEYEEILANFSALSRNLKQVGADVVEGHGTIGALLRDPTVYEDLKLVLGNVKRNRLFKALIRYTIKADDLKDPGPVGATTARK